MHGTTRMLASVAALLLALVAPQAAAGDQPGMMMSPGAAPSSDRLDFAEIDENGDQRISPTELYRARAARLVQRAQQGRSLREDQGAPRFEAIDLNGDGLIDRQELAMSEKQQTRAESQSDAAPREAAPAHNPTSSPTAVEPSQLRF